MTDEQSTMNQAERQSEDALWDMADVKTYLNVASETTVRARIAEGLPALRIGGVLRFVPDEVKAWVRGQAA